MFYKEKKWHHLISSLIESDIKQNFEEFFPINDFF